MAAMEYYQSAPGQSFASTVVGKPDQPAAPTQSSLPHKPPSKANAPDYFTPEAPHSAFVPAYVAGAPPVDDDVLPVLPSRINNLGKIVSPPAPQDPTSPVTDESDGSVVHIHHTHQAPRYDDTTHHTDMSPPPSQQSGTLSLTHSNLHHHDGFNSSDRSPSHGRGPASKKRLRPRELSTHSKDTLIQLLIRQEYQVDDCKKALKNALEKLDRYKSDLADANSHCRRVEKLYQKLADERMLMQTQVSDTVGKAQQQSYAAQQELSIYKLRLEHAENALTEAKAELREVKLQRDKARSDAERSREEALRIREEHNVREAREKGRKQGYDEGVKQGHVMGITQTVPPAITTSAGEPSTSQPPPPPPSNPNTSVTSSRSRARTATSQSDKQSSSSRNQSRASKIDVEDLVQKIRRETEERYQRQFDQQLEQERQRLQIQKLEQDQERDRELVEEREKFRQSVEAREHQRSVELEAEIETLRRLERQRNEEVMNEQQKSSILQVERDKERELKEKEQRERDRERQEREQERAEEARRLEQGQRNASRQRQIERAEAMQRDRERDQAVTEATALAARATAQANAAATASASRPKSRTSASSSGSDQGRNYMQGTPRSQPYFPMPRPPMGMPVPEVAQSRVVQPSMSMPEPNVNRSVRTPQAPVTIPAAISMPEPNVNPGGYSSQPAISMPEPNIDYSSPRPSVSMPEPYVNYSSPRPPISMPEPNVNYSSPRPPVSMPEPSINTGGRSSRSPRTPATMPAAVSIPEPSRGVTMPEPNVNHGVTMPEPNINRGVTMPQPNVSRGVSMPQPNINTGSHYPRSPQPPFTMPEPNINPAEYSRPSSRSAGQPNLPSTISGRQRPRRSSIESQSSVSTAGGLDKLVSFPLSATGGHARTPSNGSGGGPAFIPPIPEPSSRNANRQSSHSRNGTYTRPNVVGRDALSDIPEDASFRLSPGVSSPYGGQGPVIPSMGMPERDRSSSAPVIPNIRVEGDHDDDHYLHAPGGPGLRRSDSGPSICGITIEPPSGPTTPLEGGPSPLHHHHHSSADPHLLSPHHVPAPALPQVPSQQPVLPRRAESPALPIRVNVRGDGGDGGERVIPTQPNSPVIPDAQYLPPNFIPQSFTPHANATPSLPEVIMNPPPGFIPQSMTDLRTGLTTPLTNVNTLPGDHDHAGGGGSRRQSIYGSSGTSPYIGSPSHLAGGPPVIPTFGDMDNGGSSRGGTPRSGIYTPGGSTRGLPGSSVYQNPAEGDEDEENDDLVARNTRINATAPPITVKQKKKRRGGK